MNSLAADLVRCSFCGRTADEVASIIAGPDVYICDICIQNSVEILRANSSLFRAPELQRNLTPQMIRSILD